MKPVLKFAIYKVCYKMSLYFLEIRNLKDFLCTNWLKYLLNSFSSKREEATFIQDRA